MGYTLSDITFLIRLLLDILVVWGLIYSGLRIVRNNSRTIQLVKGDYSFSQGFSCMARLKRIELFD